MNVGNGALPSIFNQRFEVNFLQAPFNQLIPHANRTNSSSSLSATLLASEILQAQRVFTFFHAAGGLVDLCFGHSKLPFRAEKLLRDPTLPGGSCPR